MAILELARQEGELGVDGDHWRMISAHRGRIHSTSSGRCPNWSVVVLRMQLLGLDGVHLHGGQIGEGCRAAASSGQLYWMFWRVVKWP